MDKYREQIKKDLIRLPKEGVLLFAALICERLYPNYIYFYKTFSWGNPKVLGETIDVIFQSFFRKELFERNEIMALIEEVDFVTPNTEDFPSIYVSFALDACTSIHSTLNYILDGDVEHVVDVATYARDTVDMFIQERDDIGTFSVDVENRIFNDPLMVRERKRQEGVIERLFNINFKDINDELIESLRDKIPIINIDVLE